MHPIRQQMDWRNILFYPSNSQKPTVVSRCAGVYIFSGSLILPPPYFLFHFIPQNRVHSAQLFWSIHNIVIYTPPLPVMGQIKKRTIIVHRSVDGMLLLLILFCRLATLLVSSFMKPFLNYARLLVLVLIFLWL